jgi:glycosyltransferase involved in cell wall biosynthesis
MNKGLVMSTGDIVGTLNSDDLYANDQVLQKVMEAFQDPLVDIVYGDLVYVSATNTSRVIRYWRSKPYHPGLFEKGWMPPHPSFFARRRLYEKFGLFNLDFKIAADFELMARFLAHHSAPAVHLAEVFVKFRMGGASNQSIRNILRANLESRRACLVNGLKIGPLFILRKIGSKLPQFFQRENKTK